LGEHRLTWLDVFADAPLQGNQLAVVHDADGLDEATMLAFARETKLSETTFVQTATEPGADYRNRIFDPRGELPFAGHPSLGTAIAVARAEGRDEAAYVQQTPAGLQPIDVRLGTGVPQVIAPVRAQALAHPRPDYAALEPFLDGFGAIVLCLAACDPAAGRARARAYCHTAEMGEDPATGSAAGPLMAHLHARTGLQSLEIEQGIEMGRPSRLSCSVQGERVRVGGAAAILVVGTLRL